MDREQMCQSLITWLQTFKLDHTANSVEELSDGVVMAHVLQQIAPQFFTDSWRLKLRTDVADNWRLKVNNLKKVRERILDYYSEVLMQHIHDFQMPDLNAIGEHGDQVEMGRLLQLILGCAVNCDNKHVYIEKIMVMEEEVQHSVMNAIQDLMKRETPVGGGEDVTDLSVQLKHVVEERNTLVEEKDELAQRCYELDLQVASLQEERNSISSENERLNERMNLAEGLDDPRLLMPWEKWPDEYKSTPAGRRFQQLSAQVEKLQEEMYRLEAARDDYKIKMDLQEKEILDLQQKNEELTSLADEARAVKDELDVLRDTSYKLSKYEAAIETYKKKLEELSDLKGQIKILEDKNTSYMQQNMEMEEEAKKVQSLRTQVEAYKRQVQELQTKVTEEIKRADKAEFEVKRNQEKMTALQTEKERLRTEISELREVNDDLMCAKVKEPDMNSPGALDMLSVPQDIKEKMMRLEHENKMLRARQEGDSKEQVEVLQSMLDDASVHKNELESEIRIANTTILELKAKLEDMHESEAAKMDNSSEMRKKLSEHIQKASSAHSELKVKGVLVEELEGKIQQSAEKINKLTDQLSKKDEEMRVMEDRYKHYLEKAKSVSKLGRIHVDTSVGLFCHEELGGQHAELLRKVSPEYLQRSSNDNKSYSGSGKNAHVDIEKANREIQLASMQNKLKASEDNVRHLSEQLQGVKGIEIDNTGRGNGSSSHTSSSAGLDLSYLAELQGKLLLYSEKISHLTDQLSHKDIERQRLSMDFESKLRCGTEKVCQLSEQLNKKECDLMALEAKYKILSEANEKLTKNSTPIGNVHVSPSPNISENSRSEVEFRELEYKLHDERKRNSQLEAKLKKKSLKIGTLEMQLASSAEKLGALTEQVSKRDAEMRSMQDRQLRILSRSQSVQDRRGGEDYGKFQLLTLAEKVAKYEQDVKTLEETVDNLKAQLDAAKRDADLKEEEIRKLKSELQDVDSPKELNIKVNNTDTCKPLKSSQEPEARADSVAAGQDEVDSSVIVADEVYVRDLEDRLGASDRVIEDLRTQLANRSGDLFWAKKSYNDLLRKIQASRFGMGSMILGTIMR